MNILGLQRPSAWSSSVTSAAVYVGKAIESVLTQTRGYIGRRHTGIAAATGDWMAWLDADDIWVPTDAGSWPPTLDWCMAGG